MSPPVFAFVVDLARRLPDSWTPFTTISMTDGIRPATKVAKIANKAITKGKVRYSGARQIVDAGSLGTFKSSRVGDGMKGVNHNNDKGTQSQRIYVEFGRGDTQRLRRPMALHQGDPSQLGGSDNIAAQPKTNDLYNDKQPKTKAIAFADARADKTTMMIKNRHTPLTLSAMVRT